MTTVTHSVDYTMTIEGDPVEIASFRELLSTRSNSLFLQVNGNVITQFVPVYKVPSQCYNSLAEYISNILPSYPSFTLFKLSLGPLSTTFIESTPTTNLGAWEALRIPVTSTTLLGIQNPTFSRLLTNGSGSQGVFCYFFSNIQEQEVYFVAQLPHSYIEGTDINVHIHYVPTTAGAGTFQWGVEYSWADIGDVFSNTTLITAIGNISADTQTKHSTLNIGTIPGSGKKISSMLICRTYRPVFGNYASPIGLLELDFHFQQTGMGSMEEFVK